MLTPSSAYFHLGMSIARMSQVLLVIRRWILSKSLIYVLFF
jgi:hypothetical protein